MMRTRGLEANLLLAQSLCLLQRLQQHPRLRPLQLLPRNPLRSAAGTQRPHRPRARVARSSTATTRATTRSLSASPKRSLPQALLMLLLRLLPRPKVLSPHRGWAPVLRKPSRCSSPCLRLLRALDQWMRRSHHTNRSLLCSRQSRPTSRMWNPRLRSPRPLQLMPRPHHLSPKERCRSLRQWRRDPSL